MYLNDPKFNLINNELRRFFDEHLFGEVIGMTNAQINHLQREEDGMDEEENVAIFRKENKAEWKKMIEDKEGKYKFSEIYQAWVKLFGLPFEIGEEE